MKKPSGTAPASYLGAQRFKVGARVDVYCDHILDDSRVRDWLQGVVVQVDEKMVAVQFTQDVYLTDGWMVPDQVLWCQHGSDIIRPASRRRRTSKTSRSRK